MAKAMGVAKYVTICKETEWGVAPAKTAPTAIELRRVTADFNLTKEAYESEEIRRDRQVADYRHGTRGVEGTLNGELSAGSYANLFAAVLDGSFTAVPSITGASLTIAAGTVQGTYTIGSDADLTGVMVGQVIQLEGVDPDNEGLNLLVIGVTDLKNIIVKPLGQDVELTPEAAVTGDVVFKGKQLIAPLSAHVDESFTVEEFYSDIGQSELYTGLRVGSANIQIPASGMTTVDFSFMGKNMQEGTTQYFTAAQAASTTGIFAAATGALIVDGKPMALVTDASISVDRGLEGGAVIGSNFNVDVFKGRIRVSGNLSAYFEDGLLRSYFNDEKKISVVLALTTGSGAADDVFVVTLPTVKLGNFSKADSEQAIIASCDFTALLTNPAATGYSATTMQVVDTQA